MTMKLRLTILAVVVSFCTSSVGALAQSQPAPPGAIPATPPAATAVPNPAPPDVQAAPAAEPAKTLAVAKPRLSRCALAIRQAERKLEKSTSGPDKVASAWHHIEEAKNSRGQVCQAHAREALELL